MVYTSFIVLLHASHQTCGVIILDCHSKVTSSFIKSVVNLKIGWLFCYFSSPNEAGGPSASSKRHFLVLQLLWANRGYQSGKLKNFHSNFTLWILKKISKSEIVANSLETSCVKNEHLFWSFPQWESTQYSYSKFHSIHKELNPSCCFIS